MSRILLLYSTVDGHTVGICQRLQRAVEGAGHTVTLLPIEQAGTAELQGADKVVVGASIRYGKHRPNVLAFANQHAELLAARPSAFFSVNIVARKPLKNQPDTNPYVKKFLTQVRWRPTELDVFAGKLNYPKLGYVDRQMIRFIMLITSGPTDPTAVVEFTDWQRVEAFARRISVM